MTHATADIFWSPPPGALGRGQKVKYIKSQLQSQFQRFFKLNFVCLLKNERYKTYMTGYSFGLLGHACPRVWDLGVLGVIFYFLSMVMWHIKL